MFCVAAESRLSVYSVVKKNRGVKNRGVKKRGGKCRGNNWFAEKKTSLKFFGGLFLNKKFRLKKMNANS